MPQGGHLPQRLGYVPALDGVRALAIAPVVLFHAFRWPDGGVLGVHMFFVLSGFLITTLLLQEWHLRGSISLRRFYFRRALRLFPALAVMLGVYTVIQLARGLVIDRDEVKIGAAMEGVLYSVLYVSNVVQASGTAVAVPLTALWSLATEEQFYLLWPFLLAGALRLGARQRLIEGFLLATIGLVVAQRVRLSLSDVPPERIYYAPDTSFDMILVGCLLGLWFVTGQLPRTLRSQAFLAWSWLPAGVTVVAAFLLADDKTPEFYWGWMLPFAVATGVLILTVVQRQDGGPARALALPPLAFLGRISYSLYLWHLLIIHFGRESGVPSAVGAALSVGVAATSYYFVELPFLRRKRRDRAEVEGLDPDRAEERPTGMPAVRSSL